MYCFQFIMYKNRKQCVQVCIHLILVNYLTVKPYMAYCYRGLLIPYHGLLILGHGLLILGHGLLIPDHSLFITDYSLLK